MDLKQILKTQVGEAQFRQIPIKKFGLANSRQLGGYRCLRAHWDYGFFRVLPRTPVYITLLREPVSRIVSLFAMIRRKTNSRWNTNDIHEFIERIGAERLQVHFLAGTISGRPIQGQALLEVALTRLWEFAWFGITDDFHRSVDLLCETFGWPPVSSIETRNQAGPDDKPRLSKDIENHILEACELDVEFYKQAVEVFSSRA